MACLFCHATLFHKEKKGSSSERSQTPVIGAIRRKLVTPQRLESYHWFNGPLLLHTIGQMSPHKAKNPLYWIPRS
eukprot:scaffold1301_cov191-Pinguiococcus_pyrenoidosus.AAC.3